MIATGRFGVQMGPSRVQYLLVMVMVILVKLRMGRVKLDMGWRGLRVEMDICLVGG